MTAPPAPYENRIIAFIDILGFRELIERTISEPTLGQQILDILQNLKAIAASKTSLAEVTAFSDCIVISYPLEAANVREPILSLLGDVVALANDLLKAGVAVRGAVTTGLLYHKDGVIFGQALIEAYLLERDEATYPRIIVDESIYKYLSPQIKNNGHLKPDNPIYQLVAHLGAMLYLGKDVKDDRLFVDFLAWAHKMSHPNWEMLKEAKAHQGYLENIRNITIEQYKRAAKQDVKDKWRWMASYFNQTLQALKNEKVAGAANLNQIADTELK